MGSGDAADTAGLRRWQSNGRNEGCCIFRHPFDSYDYGESCEGQKIKVVACHSVKEAKKDSFITHPSSFSLPGTFPHRPLSLHLRG